MANDVDDQLSRLAQRPIPDLETLEADVFATIAENARNRATGRAIGIWSVGVALATGVVGGATLAGSIAPAHAAAQAAGPFGIDTPLAPSTLLLGR